MRINEYIKWIDEPLNRLTREERRVDVAYTCALNNWPSNGCRCGSPTCAATKQTISLWIYFGVHSHKSAANKIGNRSFDDVLIKQVVKQSYEPNWTSSIHLKSNQFKMFYKYDCHFIVAFLITITSFATNGMTRTLIVPTDPTEQSFSSITSDLQLVVLLVCQYPTRLHSGWGQLAHPFGHHLSPKGRQMRQNNRQKRMYEILCIVYTVYRQHWPSLINCSFSWYNSDARLSLPCGAFSTRHTGRPLRRLSTGGHAAKARRLCGE